MSAALEPQSDLFLTQEEVIRLTGRHRKSLQIAMLKQMLIPFRVNALGEPVITRAAVVGMSSKAEAANQGWAPRLAK